MSDARVHTALTAPDVEHIVGPDRRPTLVEASLSSAKSISDTMTGVIQPQINTHSTAIAAVQAQVGSHGEALASATTLLAAHGAAITAAQGTITVHGEAIAGAAARIEAQHETLAGVKAHVTGLTASNARHDHEIVELTRRVTWLENHPRASEDAESVRAEQAREMLAVNEALHERVAAMEAAIRQLLEQGPQGGGTRSRGHR